MPAAEDDRPAVSVMVLCGGTSARMGGGDKTRERLGRHTVLDELLTSLPARWPVVCVGVRRPTDREVSWARETPPGGGPVAGVTAALPLVRTAVCVLLGGDMPFAGAVVTRLVTHITPHVALEAAPDAAVAVDPTGRTQPLLAAYRLAALAAALPARPHDARLMAVLDRLRWVGVDVDARAALDVDTPEALAAARHIVAG